MSISVKKVVLAEQQPQQEGEILHRNHLELVGHIEVSCNVRVGTVTMTLDQLRTLKTGQMVHLQQKTDDPIELLVHDKVIARGALMSYADHFAIHILEVTQ